MIELPENLLPKESSDYLWQRYRIKPRDAWERHLPPLTVAATSATKLNNKDNAVAAVAAVADRKGETAETPRPETGNKMNGGAAEMPLDFSGKRLSNAPVPPAGEWSIDADD